MSLQPGKKKSIFEGKFILKRLLGKGGFGEVYEGVHTTTGEPVAIKMEKSNGKDSFLFREACVMQDIQKRPSPDGISGIATLKYYGQDGNYRMLIMALHGPSVEDMHRKLGHFSLKTTIMLADQMLSRLEYVHSVGYVHRDLKTDNFLLGNAANARRIYLIDFGLSSKYSLPDGTHREMQTGVSFLGTSRFASLRTHQGYSQSRRDDIEQLVYMMIYMYRGHLPWSGLNIKDHHAKEKRIGEIKAQLKPEEICAKCPRQFTDMLYYARNMSFAETPQYEMCHVLLQSILDEMQPPEKMDYIFDWEAKGASSEATQASLATVAVPAPVSPCTANESPLGKNIMSSDAAMAPLPNAMSSAEAKGVLSKMGSSPVRNIVSIDAPE